MTPAAAERDLAPAGATATTTLQLPFTPRAHQRDAHVARLAFRWVVLVWHRRAGKTVWAVIELILAAIQATKGDERFGYICPFLKQSKEVAWPYVTRFCRVIPGVKVNESELSVTFRHGPVIRLYGADHPDSLRGGYFDGVVLDEVGQMRRALWGEVIRPMLADRKGFAVFIGTPKGVNLFSETYFRAVNDTTWFSDKKDCYQTDALDRDEIEAARREMSPQQFAQEFLCDFFAAVENVLCPLERILEARQRDLKSDAWSWAARVLGVDVARFGDDRSTIAKRQGRVAFRIESHRGLDTMQLASRIAFVAQEEKPDAIFIDTSGGLGAGPADRCRDLGLRVIEVEFGGKADDPRYLNKRTEMYVRMSDWAKDGCLPDDEDLAQELVAHTYDFDSGGRMRLSPKDDVKERLGRSPDLSDALACTFHTHIAPPDRELAASGLKVPGRAVLTEYDPYAQA
jgi:hypothetical protein